MSIIARLAFLDFPASGDTCRYIWEGYILNKGYNPFIHPPNSPILEPFIEGLPGFPDNISSGFDGLYWVALASPRNPLLDKLSDKPFLRKVIQRMPAFIRPKAVAYGHIILIDEHGEVVKDLQDSSGSYPINTSVTETEDYLYIGNLVSPFIGRLPKKIVH